MSYQPNLFIRNIGNANAKKVHDLVSNFQFGKIANIEIFRKKKETCAIVKMEKWDTKHTECTRIMLSQGKPISLYYTENECWKVYAHKENESDEYAILAKKRKNEKKKKEAEEKEKALLKKQQEEILDRELARIAEECRIQMEQEMREQWKELHDELQAKQVVLDYVNIGEYRRVTKASKKLRDLMKKLK